MSQGGSWNGPSGPACGWTPYEPRSCPAMGQWKELGAARPTRLRSLITMAQALMSEIEPPWFRRVGGLRDLLVGGSRRIPTMGLRRPPPVTAVILRISVSTLRAGYRDAECPPSSQWPSSPGRSLSSNRAKIVAADF
jgi:hypothetical protein